MKGVDADRLHALEEEHGRKAAAVDLVRQIALGFLDAGRGQLVGKILVAEAAGAPARRE